MTDKQIAAIPDGWIATVSDTVTVTIPPGYKFEVTSEPTLEQAMHIFSRWAEVVNFTTLP